MGLASAFLVPGAFYIVTKQLFNDRDMYDVSPVVQTQDGAQYRLLTFRGEERSPILLAREIARHRWTTELQVLHTIENVAKGDVRYVVSPNDFKAFARSRRAPATLWLSPDGTWVYVIFGLHNLVAALHTTNNEIFVGDKLVEFSPFALLTEASTIDEREKERLLVLYKRAVRAPEFASEIGLASYETLLTHTQLGPRLARTLAVSLLPLFESRVQTTKRHLERLKDEAATLAVRAAAADALQHPHITSYRGRRERRAARPQDDVVRSLVEQRVGIKE